MLSGRVAFLFHNPTDCLLPGGHLVNRRRMALSSLPALKLESHGIFFFIAC